MRKAVELAAGHRAEEGRRKCPVIAPESSDERLTSRGERHERRTPVRRMGIAGHETVGDECVHEPGHRTRR